MNEPTADQMIIMQVQGTAVRLMKCLLEKEPTVQKKYEYYNADNEIRDFGISIPKKMVNHLPGIGWAGRAVHTLSDRVVFEGFAGDTFGVNDYWEDIRAASIVNKAKSDAFIGGCAFVGIADDPNPESDRKVLVPFTAMEATGIVDQNTGLLAAGLAVTKWAFEGDGIKKKRWMPHSFVVFTPEYTAVYEQRTLYDIQANPTGRCLLHPITHRASADRPLGKSRLTNTARRIIQEVGRLKRREEIAEEFYSTPQRYITGLAENAEKDDSMDSQLGKLWAITKGEDDINPVIGQLPQMSISQFSEAKKDKARDFCAETALTLRNLGYETGNPSTAESLAAMSDDLLLEAQASQDEMGQQIKQIAITLRMALDGSNVVPTEMKSLVPAWKPIFQVDVGAAGDAVFKLLQSLPELAGSTAVYRMLGIGIREAEELAAKRKAAAVTKFMVGDGGGNGGAS